MGRLTFEEKDALAHVLVGLLVLPELVESRAGEGSNWVLMVEKVLTF